MVDAVYLTFLALSAVVFWHLPVRPSILLTFLGGWIVLPVVHYPPIDPEEVFPWWITGIALPADMLVSKAWLAPVAALLAAVVSDMSALRRFRPGWRDLPMVLWCLWPLTGDLWGVQASPPPAVSSLYLAGCWGAPWLLGRIWFGTTSDQVLFLKASAWAGLACLPMALLEGGLGISLYSALFGQHPYFADGWTRYVGFRPIGLFEHGNQYGIWVALSAFAAIWTAVAVRRSLYIALACLTTAIALAAQSVGAILLMCLGLVILAVWQLRIVWPLLVTGLCCVAVLAALHLSGIVPLQWIARDTAIGRDILNGFRAVGRGSFLWRMSQDIKTLGIVHDAFLTGTMVWDWWRPAQIRPWGLWMLILGQFGIVGFLLGYGSIFGPAGQAMRRLRGAPVWTTTAAALPLALIVLLALADSALNAFLHFPAILAAGALASGAHIRN